MKYLAIPFFTKKAVLHSRKKYFSFGQHGSGMSFPGKHFDFFFWIFHWIKFSISEIALKIMVLGLYHFFLLSFGLIGPQFMMIAFLPPPLVLLKIGQNVAFGLVRPQ
jgi:hypothetical protein